VPQEQFESALADPNQKPSTAGIIAAAEAEKHPDRVPVSAEALWLWGRLRDFRRDGLLAKHPAEVMLTMTEEMLDDVHELAPRVANWLKKIGEGSAKPTTADVNAFLKRIADDFYRRNAERSAKSD
jgi:hypothetical protein